MIPLQSRSQKYQWKQRSLPTSSTARGVARPSYRDKGYIYLTAYCIQSSEVKSLHGITDGTLWQGYLPVSKGVTVGDRLKRVDDGQTFEVLSAQDHTHSGKTLTMKEIE